MEGASVYETLLPGGRTLFEVMESDPEADWILARFFEALSQFHEQMIATNQIVSHGDLSITNVLLLGDGRLGLIDYDSVRVLERASDLLRDYEQFLASIEFYYTRHGLKSEHIRWRLIGIEHYEVQFRFTPAERDHWKAYWAAKNTQPRLDYTDQYGI